MRRTILGTFLRVSLLVVIALVLMIASGVQAQGEKQKAALPLEKTQWKLTWVAGTKIEVSTPQQVPYFQLDPESHRVSGSGGCNRLTGGYELNGDHLKFTQMAMTRMMCLHGGDTEAHFTQALDQVREWMFSKGRLLLLDADHHVVAKFSGVPPSEP